MRKELLIGCGGQRTKLLTNEACPVWTNLVTLDINPDHKPDVLWDLMVLPLPFADNTLDEIHAYEVLEHTGTQGDYKFFFAQFSDFWRILKPDGLLLATCPSLTSPWLWGDPSHSRVIQRESLVFLRQSSYEAVGKTTMSDFRNIYKADFEVVHCISTDNSFQFVLQAVKPSRIKE